MTICNTHQSAFKSKLSLFLKAHWCVVPGKQNHFEQNKKHTLDEKLLKKWLKVGFAL